MPELLCASNSESEEENNRRAASLRRKKQIIMKKPTIPAFSDDDMPPLASDYEDGMSEKSQKCRTIQSVDGTNFSKNFQ
jgi:hypothetical protein